MDPATYWGDYGFRISGCGHAVDICVTARYRQALGVPWRQVMVTALSALSCCTHRPRRRFFSNTPCYTGPLERIYTYQTKEAQNIKMTIPYHIIGKQRKQLAEDVSVALHTIPKYLGYPTCAYRIGDCILERDGKLIISECVADETATALLEYLRSCGYVGAAVENEDRLTVSLPKEQFTSESIETL